MIIASILVAVLAALSTCQNVAAEPFLIPRDVSITYKTIKTTSVYHAPISTTTSTATSMKTHLNTKTATSTVTSTDVVSKTVTTTYTPPIMTYPVNVNALAEGKVVLDKAWTSFWNKDKNALSTSNCKWNQPVIWDLAVTLQSFADGEVHFKGHFTDHVNKIYDIMDNYYNNKMKGYSAGTGKDNDIYYDDNAQIVTALITAYEATNDSKFLNRAADVVEFLEGGWNSKIGGVTWHYNSPYVASISTLETALASFRLYKHNKDKQHLQFAEKCMDWIKEKLWDSKTNLILDGIDADSGGMTTYIFTYQAGTAISLCTYLYQETKDTKWSDMAQLLVDASVNHNSPIFNRDYKQDYRFWTDGFNFGQLLTEGISDYIASGLSNNNVTIKGEFLKETQYVYQFARSPDGQYYSKVNPEGNSKDAVDKWNKFADDSRKAHDDYNNNYCDSDTSKSFSHGLMNECSVAHIYFKTGVIIETI